MKLFIWEGDGVLTDYSNGMICAIAPDLETALIAIEAAEPSAANRFHRQPSEIVRLDECVCLPKAWVCFGGG